jgi:putative hydrolase of the HAD superfamily
MSAFRPTFVRAVRIVMSIADLATGGAGERAWTDAAAPAAPTMSRVRAVLFDLDGTLYVQRPVRLRMAVEIAAFVATRPSVGSRALRVVKAYREAQESLRRHVDAIYDERMQLQAAAERSAVPIDEAARIVDEWMFERPLKHVAKFRAPGLVPLLERLSHKGLRLGVLSDYAAERKLRALGVHKWFSQVASASDIDIRALKPNPRGFLVACARWGLAPDEVVMVGDRADADGAGAAAAGMRSVIIGKRPHDNLDLRTAFVSSLDQVDRVIDDCC